MALRLTAQEKKFQMERISNLYKEVVKDAVRAGLPYDEKKVYSTIQINNRTTAVGMCKYTRSMDMYTIFFSSYFIDISDDKVKNTLMHELIHTLPNCMNHKEPFKRYMRRINYASGLSMEYHVATRNDDNEVIRACKNRQRQEYSKCETVRIVCGCGCKFVFKKSQKVAKHPEQYQCRKHGKTLRFAEA